MRRAIGIALVSAWLLGGAAQATAYDDLAAAITAALRYDYDTAVKGFTAALAAPDLAAAYKPTAYRGRATAYLHTDRCDDALADIKAFSALKPEDETAVSLHLWASLCRKDVAAARGDLETQLKAKLSAFSDKPEALDAARAASIWAFARLEWRYGLYPEAASAAREAFALSNKKFVMATYILLWEALNESRAGTLDKASLASSAALLEKNDWPRPVLELYLGKSDWKGLEKDASSWREFKDTAQRCEANFYGAEWHLGQGDRENASRLLLAVMDKCPVDFLEHDAARSELKRLGIAVPEERR